MNDTVDTRKRIGSYCKRFREDKLEMTLNYISDLTEYKYQTLYSFEHGKSSNMKILVDVYLYSCDSYKLKYDFISGLVDTM